MKAFRSFHWHGACLLPLICTDRCDLINPGLAGQKGDKCVLRHKIVIVIARFVLILMLLFLQLRPCSVLQCSLLGALKLSVTFTNQPSGLINLNFIKQNLILQSFHTSLDLLDDLSLVKNEKQNSELGQKNSPTFTSRILEKTWMMSALRISLASLVMCLN